MHKAVFLLCAAAIALPGQSLTTLATFNGFNGASASSGLIQASDGSYYGTTDRSIYRLTPAGALTTIYIFDSGVFSSGGLIQATDGNFYGTTAVTGASPGTIFKITPSGVLTTLHNFVASGDYPPNAPLIQAPDGNIYGSTPASVYKIAPDGALTVISSLPMNTPLTGLTQGRDGNFYGVSAAGGTNGEQLGPGA